MGTVLVTGASGFIGRVLCAELAGTHDVVAMSRRRPDVGVPWVRGDYASFEDLRQLDGRSIDAVVHLGAVTGGCLERDGILANVEGTRCLMRYLMDHGCRRFVMASSIAAVGMQSVAFRPVALPMPDEHPCLDRDGYGLSKYLMEEVTRYYARQTPESGGVNLRRASICPDESPSPKGRPGPVHEWACGAATVMVRSDAVRVFRVAVEAPLRPGVLTLNAAGPRAGSEAPTADLLRSWWGDDVDLSHYESPGHEYDGLYDVSAIERELGFVARVQP